MKKWMNRIWARAETQKDSHPLRLHGHLIRAVAEEARPPDEAWDFEVLIARAGYSRDGEWFLPREVLREGRSPVRGARRRSRITLGRAVPISGTWSAGTAKSAWARRGF